MKILFTLFTTLIVSVTASATGLGEVDDPSGPDIVCDAKFAADGTIIGTDCAKNECKEELLCCDTNTGGCFCAQTETNARCPKGSVKAPESD